MSLYRVSFRVRSLLTGQAFDRDLWVSAPSEAIAWRLAQPEVEAATHQLDPEEVSHVLTDWDVVRVGGAA